MKKYNGTENLEWMKLAKNYNTFLVELIEKDIDSCKKNLDFGAGTGTFCDE
jgi:hypothetical protein